MFDKIRLWWKYNGSYIPKNIVRGIKNLWKWFPIVWKDRDWDHTFIYKILEFKLKNQSKYIGNKDRHTRSQYDSTRMDLVARLIQKQTNEEYNIEYMDYQDIEIKFEPIIDGESIREIKFETKSENYDDYFAKYPTWYRRAIKYIQTGPRKYTNDETDKSLVEMVMSDLKQAKCQELIFKLMEYHIRGWWD